MGLKVITYKEYNLDCLKAQWKSATSNDWLTHISTRLLEINKEAIEDPSMLPYLAGEMLFLAKKLEVLGCSLEPIERIIVDPRQ